MNFNEMTKVLFKMWKQALEADRPPTTVCLLGPPGVGKTTVGIELAEMMTSYMRSRQPSAPPAVTAPGGALDLSSMLPEDLGGIPFRDGNLTRYCPQAWLEPFCSPDAYGVLILDDLPAASSAVQVACRQVSLTHRVHEMRLSDRVLVLVTGNRREDKSSATTLPAHFRNSVLILNFEPEFEGWERWYMKQPGASRDIPAFLRFKDKYFSLLPKDADETGAFATPRTWSMLGNLLPILGETEVQEVAAGLVGKGVAVELAAFQLLRRNIADPAAVLADPKKALPDLSIISRKPDRLIALCTGLADVTSTRAKEAKKLEDRKDLYLKYLRALEWVTRNDREYISHSLSTFIACEGSMSELTGAIRDVKKGSGEPEIQEMLAAIAKVFASS